MVDHVERRHLVVFLPEYEESGVEEVHKLAEEIPPAQAQHPHGRWTTTTRNYNSSLVVG